MKRNSLILAAIVAVILLLSRLGGQTSAEEYQRQAYEARMKARRGHCEIIGIRTATCYGNPAECEQLRQSIDWFTHEYGETPEFACQQADRPFGTGE